MRNIYLVIALSAIALFTSCSNSVDFGEQYKKAVYIVNSKEMIYYASHNVSEVSKGRISIYVTGSELPKSDIRVSYKVDEEALNKYNQKEYGDNTKLYFSMIPADLYSFQESEVVIKGGHPYGCLNFTINTLALNSDNTYILPISIVSAEGAEVNETSHTILYVVQVTNDYAGSYVSTCKIGGIGSGEIKKKVQALSKQKLFLPISNNSNVTSGTTLGNTDYYQITVKDDYTVVVESYLGSKVYENTVKRSYYDPEDYIFYIYYKIPNKYEDEAPVEVEEILKRTF